MKTYLIPQNGNFYKANLHSHSTCSDGKATPQELKDLYKSAGYSVLAYSDHNVLVDHSELNDDTFLTLTSVEVDALEKAGKSYFYSPCYHVNFFSPAPHMADIPAFERDYSKINDLVHAFTDKGFLAMLNHPTWSQQTMKDYENLDTSAFFAMEIYNHCSSTEGYDEVNSHIYDELLRTGAKLFCTATDDNHNLFPITSPRFDALGGFVMIKAPELTYDAIFNALKNGHFYASNGPKIHEIYVEDNQLVVKTSDAVKIYLSTAVRQAQIVCAEQIGGTVNEARFDLSNIRPGYVRVTVTDQNGNNAWSQPLYGEFGGMR